MYFIKKQLTRIKLLCIIQIKHNKNVLSPLHDLSHFQSTEGDFIKKGERHEQTQRLSGHVGANPASYGGQARYFFAVIQQQRNRQNTIQ